MPTRICLTGQGPSICICVTAPAPQGTAGRGSTGLPQTCTCPAAPWSGRSTTWPPRGICKKKADSAPTEAPRPISIRSYSQKERTSPQRETCALFVNRGEVHHEPPWRTHSIWGLVQRKNLCNGIGIVEQKAQLIVWWAGLILKTYNIIWRTFQYTTQLLKREHRNVLILF